MVGVRHVIPAAWLVFAGRATRIPHCPNHVPYGYGSLDVRSETPAAPGSGGDALRAVIP